MFVSSRLPFVSCVFVPCPCYILCLGSFVSSGPPGLAYLPDSPAGLPPSSIAFIYPAVFTINRSVLSIIIFYLCSTFLNLITGT